MTKLSTWILALGLPAVAMMCGCGHDETAAVQAEQEVEEPAEAPPTLDQLVAKAEQGDSASAFAAAQMYQEQGLMDSAFTWYKRAARDGHVDAIYNVGLFYRDGLAGEPDSERAVRCFKMAMDKGQPDAEKAYTLLQINREWDVDTAAAAEEDLDNLEKTELIKALREKAQEETAEWSKSEELADRLDGQRELLLNEYGIETEFIDKHDYTPTGELTAAFKKRVAADIKAQVEAEFGPEKRSAVEAEAKSKIEVYRVGDAVKLQTRRGMVQGQLRSVGDSGVKVSSIFVPMADLPDEEVRKFDTARYERDVARYVASHYNVPKTELERRLLRDLAGDVFKNAGYVLINNEDWRTTAAVMDEFVTPRMAEYKDSQLQQWHDTRLRELLAEHGLKVVRNRILSEAEYRKIVDLHTAKLRETAARVEQMLVEAKTVAQYDNVLRLSAAALNACFLASNLDEMKAQHQTLLQGRALLQSRLTQAQAPVSTRPTTGGDTMTAREARQKTQFTLDSGRKRTSNRTRDDRRYDSRNKGKKSGSRRGGSLKLSR